MYVTRMSAHHEPAHAGESILFQDRSGSPQAMMTWAMYSLWVPSRHPREYRKRRKAGCTALEGYYNMSQNLGPELTTENIRRRGTATRSR
jgi:hypothetical protein